MSKIMQMQQIVENKKDLFNKTKKTAAVTTNITSDIVSMEEKIGELARFFGMVDSGFFQFPQDFVQQMNSAQCYMLVSLMCLH